MTDQCKKQTQRRPGVPPGHVPPESPVTITGIRTYGERRFVTLGLLAGFPVSIAHTETDHEIRIFSFRKATKRETNIYVTKIQN